MLSESGSHILKALENEHAKIMAYEACALQALAKGDKTEYTDKMRDKAILLAELNDNLGPLLSSVNSQFWENVKKKIAGFSENANLALDLDSSFFMSALLYPEDHVTGMPDNLQRLIMDIKKHLQE